MLGHDGDHALGWFNAERSQKRGKLARLEAVTLRRELTTRRTLVDVLAKWAASMALLPPVEPVTRAQACCFDGPGEMRALCRRVDWAETPLGPSRSWPESLRVAVQLLLAQPSAALLLWGEELVTLYNDAARGLLGEQHPSALGRPARVKAEPGCAAVYRTVLGGEEVTRRGRAFDALEHGAGAPFVNNWSPIRDGTGAVAGVLATACEAAPSCEHELRLALRAAKLFTWTVDAELRRVEYSDNYAEVIGFAAAASPCTLDDACASWAYPADVARFTEGVARTLAGHGDLHLEYRLRHPRTGEIVWVETHATCLPCVSGGASVAGVAQNVTARKRIEHALRDSEARQAFLLELGDNLALIADPAEIQRASAEMLGKQLGADYATYCEYDAESGDAVLRRGWARAGDPLPSRTYCMHHYPALIGALRAGRDYATADMQAEAWASERPSDLRGLRDLRGVLVVPLVKSGKLVAFFSLLQLGPRRFEAREAALLREAAERTWAAAQRAQAEEELRASEERLQATLVAGRMAHWRWDPLTDRVRAADTMSELFGLGDGVQAVLLEGQLFAAVHPEDLREHQTEVQAAVRERRGWHREYRVIRPKDGEIVWLEESAHAIVEPVRGRVEIIGLVWDITDRKRAEAALRDSEALARLLLSKATESSREAEAASRAKDEFLATLSHELRTPVAAILLWAGAVRSGAVAPGDVGRALDAIVQSANSQSRLIEELLDLSRLQSGKLSLAPTVVDVTAVIGAALDVVRPAANAKGTALALEMQRRLGLAVFDAARLQQVLWSLLSNAVAFTPAGGRIVVRARRHEDWLELEVEDDGEGIEPDFMPYLFERFRQADTGDTRRHGGLGIGLALSRQLVELQGGSIGARSEGRGRGALFWVCLPWIEPEGRQALEGVARDASRNPLERVGVLLVEDDERTREGMALTLERAGAAVVAVASGKEALARLAERTCEEAGGDRDDVIVCDLGLPGMSGYELIRHVVDTYRGRGLRVPPACAVSAHARDVDRVRAIDAGFDLYVTKPITPERLIEAVEDLRDIARTQCA